MKKLGRPKGSKNKQTEMATAVRVPPSCRKCGSEDIVRRPGSKVHYQEYGTAVAGVSYRAVRWVPSVCRSCGQAITVRELIGAAEK